MKQVQFLPKEINGQAREYDWLWNMGDWMISKKRYWGLALPMWVDDNDPTQFEVIGSYEELKTRGRRAGRSSTATRRTGRGSTR